MKDLTNRVSFLQAQSFWEHTFLARMRRLKNGWPLSAPPRAYFYHPQLLKKKLVQADIKQLSQKKNWEVLMKIEEIQALSVLDGLNLPKPKAYNSTSAFTLPNSHQTQIPGHTSAFFTKIGLIIFDTLHFWHINTNMVICMWLSELCLGKNLNVTWHT